MFFATKARVRIWRGRAEYCLMYDAISYPIGIRHGTEGLALDGTGRSDQ
jgi:hypothetical protein